MHIVEILEKRERAIYQLFLLLSESCHLSIRDASQQIQLSKSTLLRYIDSFNSDAVTDDLGLTFPLHHEEITVKRSAHLSRQDFLSYLCQFSLKYQILMSLFDKQEFSISILSQDLAISEATLNRQLAMLNQSLSSFHISIRNGRLKGSELQIRHLYFQLLWKTQVSSHWEEDRIFKEQLQHLPIFERFYHSQFNPRQTQQLALWLMILQKRNRLRELDFTDCYKRMEPYEDHKFYRNLRSLFLTLQQQFSVTFHEGDIMSVFAFLFSNQLLEAHQLEQVIGFGGPIMEATTWAFQEIKKSIQTDLAIEEAALYHLNQLFSHLYFFTSDLALENQETKLVDRSFSDSARQMLKNILSQVYLRPREEESSQAVAVISQLYLYLSQVEPTVVEIGFASGYHAVITDPILQLLREKLEINRSILIKEFQQGIDYDLVISYDYPLAHSRVYHIYGYPNQQDLKDLKELIVSLHQAKLEQSIRLVERTQFPIERR